LAIAGALNLCRKIRDLSEMTHQSSSEPVEQLRAALADIDISAYNAAKWRIQRAIDALDIPAPAQKLEWQAEKIAEQDDELQRLRESGSPVGWGGHLPGKVEP
jgi:hypothetical protein